MIRSFIVVAVSLICSYSWADSKDKESSPQDSSSEETQIIKTKSSLSTQSVDIRRDKRWGFDFGLSYRTRGLELKSGVNIFISGNDIVQLNIGYLSGTITENSHNSNGWDDDDWDDDDWYDLDEPESISLEGNAISVNYKKFFSNSFYGLFGLEYSEIRSRFDAGGFLGLGETYSIRDISRTALDLRAGNQWQWSHFTMGVDWIGLLIPIHTSKTEQNTQLYRNEKLLKHLDQLEEFDFSLFRFYLGVNF